MEIRDPIHGAMEVTVPEAAVVDSPVFQRLRAIKQLGFGEFSYPGATHNRYLHSLGAFHLAGEVFDQIFQGYNFKNRETRWRLRQALRLAALLHDVGHGPLSHTTEEVMPSLKTLGLDGVYKKLKPGQELQDRQANHEDYTIKFILDSPLTPLLREQFSDLDPVHVACLIDHEIQCPDDCFLDNGINLRPILNQIISSELDVDRLDYLLRDSYFCGTDYGRIELKWLITNLTYNIVDQKMFLALSRRALYTFDDFLISRHHMYLMVYFHHKAIIYDEMLHRYLTSPDCDYRIPGRIEEYLKFTDFHLYEHLNAATNSWARRIAERRPYRNLFELHQTTETPRPGRIKKALETAAIDVIHSSSIARLSKYHQSLHSGESLRIFVIDPYDLKEQPYPLEQSTDIFQLYEKHRRVERLYVAPERYHEAVKIIKDL